MVAGGAVVKNPPASAGVTGEVNSVRALQDPLEKEMANHSSILAWEIPWTGSLVATTYEVARELDMT